MSSLVSVPPEILVKIALDVALVDDLGPPTHLAGLFRTCRHTHTVLARNAHLYASIYKARFDTTAPRRRIGAHALHSKSLAAQLVRVCIAMKRIRSGDIYSDSVEDDLWTAYLMLLDNDGRNAAQLDEYANLPEFIDRFVRTRLAQDKLPNGWPRYSTINALALWLLWMTTDQERLRHETNAAAEEIIAIVLPYVYGSFRYPAFYAADIHYRLPFTPQQVHVPHSFDSAHGPYPLYPPEDASAVLPYCGGNAHLGAPLLVPAAQLVYFQRRSTNRLPTPHNLAATRAEAIEAARAGNLDFPAGFFGPTLADYAEFNSRVHCGHFDRGDKDRSWMDSLTLEELEVEMSGEQNSELKAPSARWDCEWDRLLSCWDLWGVKNIDFGKPWETGSTTGLWVGKMLMPQENQYFLSMQDPSLPPDFSEMNPWMGLRLLYMRLREHHSISPAEQAPCGGEDRTFDDGVRDGWFPRGRFEEAGGIVRFTDRFTEKTHVYETYWPDAPTSHSEETCTLCLGRRKEEEKEYERMQQRALLNYERDGEQDMEVDSDDDDDDKSSLSDSDYADTEDYEDDDHSSVPHPLSAPHTIEPPLAGVPMDIILDDHDHDHPYDSPRPPSPICPSVRSSLSLSPSQVPSTSLLQPETDPPPNLALNIPEDVLASFQEAFEWNDKETQLLDWECTGFQDLIVTGETDTRHGEAWGQYRFFGRMRVFDGLLAIVAIPSDQRTQGNLGKWIYRGYIFGGKIFTGKWRHTAYDVDMPPWEGAFVCCKQEDEDADERATARSRLMNRRACVWHV